MIFKNHFILKTADFGNGAAEPSLFADIIDDAHDFEDFDDVHDVNVMILIISRMLMMS